MLVMISQRLRGIGEDGEAIDGLAPKLQEAFQEYANISIEDENGELRSTYDILQDLAQVWPTLTSQQRQYLGELAAGNRQVKVLNSIMAGWQDVEAAVENANNSVGSAEQENVAFMDSIQGRLNNLTSTFQQFANESLSSDTVKWFIDLANGALQAVDAIGGLQTILVALTGFAITKFGPGIVNTFSTIGTAIYTVVDDIRQARAGGASLFSSLQTGISNLGSAWSVFGGIATSVISLIVGGISYWRSEQEKAWQTAIKAGEEAQAQNEELIDLATQYITLSEAVKTDSSAKEDLLEVQQKLIDNLGAEKEGIDGVTASLQQQTAEQLKANQATLLAAVEAEKDKAIDAAYWEEFWRNFWGGNGGVTDSDREAVQGILDKYKIQYDDETTNRWILPGDWSTIEGQIERVKALKQALVEIQEQLGSIYLHTLKRRRHQGKCLLTFFLKYEVPPSPKTQKFLFHSLFKSLLTEDLSNSLYSSI